MPVLFCDADVLVVNKPSGLPTLPDGYDADSPYLAAVLEPHFGQVWVVHRLDRDTSGVVVLARTAEAHRLLNAQFQERDVEKVYHAIVAGNPAWNERAVAAALRIDADRQHRTIVDLESGKPSSTQFHVLERYRSPAAQFALVEARPKTGRMHQIRVHLCTLGLPVVADRLYGDGAPILLSSIKNGYRAGKPLNDSLYEEAERPLLNRLGLHALRLTLLHPITGAAHAFEAPYPKDFKATLSQLRKHALRQTPAA